MGADFSEDVHVLGGGIGVVGQRHEGCRAVVDGIGGSEWKVAQVCFCWGEGRGEDDRVDVLLFGLARDKRGMDGYERWITHAALKNAEATLEDVHNGVIDPFPVIDDLVIVDPRNNICWSIILSCLLGP